MAELIPVSEFTAASNGLKSEASDCIDVTQDVERYAALVKLMGPNLDLVDLLYIAQETALSAPPGEKRDKAHELLEATVARYEQLKRKIPQRKMGHFILCRLKYFVKIGDADECRRLIREGDGCDFYFLDVKRHLREAREAGHDEAADAVSEAVARWK